MLPPLNSRLNLAQVNAKVKKKKKMVFNSRPKLNPWFITGFFDAEESVNFSVNVQQNFTPIANLKPGPAQPKKNENWRAFPVFSIRVHNKKTIILKDIKNTLGVGIVRKTGTIRTSYIVESIKDLKVLINHFDNYPLISSKLSDYLLFKQCFEMIKHKKYKIEEGIFKLMSLKNSLDGGISNYFKILFPDIVTLNKHKPEYFFKGIPHPA